MNKIKTLRYWHLIFLVLFLGSCYLLPPKMIGKEWGLRQPAKETYRLSKKEFEFRNIIDTTSIYLYQGMYYQTNRRGKILKDLRPLYFFMRFSGNGVVFLHHLKEHQPNDFDINSMVGGQFCFYTFIGPLTIKIEWYTHRYRQFKYWYGKIQNNGDILIYEERGRSWWPHYRVKLNYLFKLTPAQIERPVVFPTY